MSDRERRIGENEAVFRQVNEQVERLNETFAVFTDHMVIVCECGADGCFEQLRITRDEYEALRSDPALFAIRPGHEIADVEDVVSRKDRYWVVAKRAGIATRIAEQTDPRRPDDRPDALT